MKDFILNPNRWIQKKRLWLLLLTPYSKFAHLRAPLPRKLLDGGVRAPRFSGFFLVKSCTYTYTYILYIAISFSCCWIIRERRNSRENTRTQNTTTIHGSTKRRCISSIHTNRKSTPGRVSPAAHFFQVKPPISLCSFFGSIVFSFIVSANRGFTYLALRA